MCGVPNNEVAMINRREQSKLIELEIISPRIKHEESRQTTECDYVSHWRTTAKQLTNLIELLFYGSKLICPTVRLTCPFSWKWIVFPIQEIRVEDRKISCPSKLNIKVQRTDGVYLLSVYAPPKFIPCLTTHRYVEKCTFTWWTKTITDFVDQMFSSFISGCAYDIVVFVTVNL